jgi:acetolactate synthase-1/2/3 large subunit
MRPVGNLSYEKSASPGGSVQMNIQELQTIKGLGLNVLVFILNNDGYLSIKQTQRNFFGREAGSSSNYGLTFPDFIKLGKAFSFKSFSLTKNNWEADLNRILETPGPVLCEVKLDTVQEFEPRLKSRMENGMIKTPELEDMYPFLDSEEILAVSASALALN